jgi:large subunit ribosomal protein L21
MYAIIAAGGKQHKVEVGQILRLEKIEGAVGDRVSLKPVLLVGGDDSEPKIGQPFLEGEVLATVLDQHKSRKILVMKKKRRKGYRVKRGHRQPYTAVRVVAIEA